MRVGSLFSGIGGLDLGLERAGMTVAWQSEIDPYASRVLAKHWPNVPNLGDITTIDWSTVEPVDLICGGYPCQPFSLAGARAGENDRRHLWPYFADALRRLRPRYALLENVPGHLSLGFGRVLGDLAELGFDAEWDSIPAAAVGAPHLRYRVFVVAHADREQHEGGAPPIGRTSSADVLVADTDPKRWGGRPGSLGPCGWAEPADGRSVEDTDADAVGNAGGAPEDAHAAPGGSRGATSKSGWWTTEPNVGRVADGVPARVDRLRALGNAVVPQVAEFIGRRIMQVAA